MSEVADPQAGPGRVVIEVVASSINPIDRRNVSLRPTGWVPGGDVVGRVVTSGTDGTGPEVGTTVFALAPEGAWAERIAVDVDRVAALPDGSDLEQAATLPLAGLTAVRTLRLAEATAGSRVLVTAANGSVGRLQVQLAAAGGGTVSALGNPTAHDTLRALGAVEVAASIENVDGPFDAVVDSIGGDVLGAAIDKLAPRGSIVIFGNSSGEPTPVSFPRFQGHEFGRILSFQSFASGPGIGSDLAPLGRALLDGSLRAGVATTVSWRNIDDAFAASAARPSTGKVVIRIGE